MFSKALDSLKTSLTGNKATYLHRNSGIPLFGNVAFGIVYRESSIIEIKPMNGCNLDCVYCSISEGLSSRKNDFVVEKDYMVSELFTLLEFVGEPVEIHIGVQGEPFLYGDIEGLITDLQAHPMIHTISIDTNGTMLSKAMIDRLALCTKLQLNLSLDAIDPDIAKKMAGITNYNIKHVLEVISYASARLNVIVAPVMVKKYNEAEMEKVIAWIAGLEVQPKLGIQNFLRYKTGRNPAQEIPWDKFYKLIEGWETKYKIKLRWSKDDFKIRETKKLPKPFKKADVVNAIVKSVDRFPGGVIAVAQGRTISIPDVEFRRDMPIKVKIARDKHNIFVGSKV